MLSIAFYLRCSECRYAEGHYSECYYAECCGVLTKLECLALSVTYDSQDSTLRVRLLVLPSNIRLGILIKLRIEKYENNFAKKASFLVMKMHNPRM